MAVKRKHKEQEFLHLMRDADRRFYAEIAARRADPERFAAHRKGRHFMEKTRRIGKYVIGGIAAAALLCGGGYAAMVALRNNQGIFGEESRDIRSMVEEQNPDEKPALHLTAEGTNTYQNMHGLEASFYNYGYSWFAETDSGYYFYQSSYDEIWEIDAEGSDNYASDVVNMRGYYAYKEKEAGKTVPLCARPNCLHDGNEYCAASTKAYSTNQLFSYENQLYTIAAGRGADGDSKEVFVLRYATDGTGIEELTQYQLPYENCRVSVGVPIMYRGYLFASVGLDCSTEGDGSVGSGYHVCRGGAVVCYELATGKGSILLTEMPDFDKGGTKEVGGVKFGRGDKLYLATKSTVRELDLHTMEVKTVCAAESENTVFTDDAIFYLDGNYGDTRFLRYDYDTGEETRVIRTAVPTEAQRVIPAADDKYFYLAYRTENGDELIITDHSYQPVVTIGLGADDTYFGREFYSDGEYLYRISQEEPMTYTWIDDETRETSWDFDIDRNIYLIRIKISDLLASKGADKADWETLLTLDEIKLSQGKVENHMQIEYH